MQTLQNICVYCASSSLVDQAYKDLARDVGALLARQNRRLVYGGGHVGLMGILADAALSEGGEVVGVIPKLLQDKEVAHRGLTQLHVTEDMQTRQKKMAELSDGFVILPGGLGTLAEFFEIVTWGCLGLHQKPICFLDPNGYWAELYEMLDKAYAEKFLRQSPTELFQVFSNVDDFETLFL